MRQFKTNRCPVCNKLYRENLAEFEAHIRNEHPGTIPEGWTIRHYVYFLHTGKTAGSCRVCKGPTEWNEATGCYARICKNPECRKKFRAEFLQNCKNAGKEDFMNDPKHREKMLVNRRISGLYKFSDGGEVAYMGKLEKAFLYMLDTFFRFPSSDIMGPSPNRYIYWYDNPNDPEHVGEHTYIPDFYIPSANLEIEIKSATNARPGNLTVDVVRDAFKDVRMIRDPVVNYVKLYEEDYHVFFQVFADLAEQNMTGQHELIKYVSRALLTSIYREHIPPDCMKVIEKYIYKYSAKSVLPSKAAEAIDADSVDPDLIVEATDEGEDEHPEFTDITKMYLPDDELESSEDEPNDNPVTIQDLILSLDPFIYYEALLDNKPATESLALDIFDIGEESDCGVFSAMEALGVKDAPKKKEIDTNTVAGRAAVQNRSWKEKLFGNNRVAAKVFTKVETTSKGNILITGINCNLLLYRIKEKYGESRLKYIFEYNYNAKSWKQFQKKQIARGEMKIDSVQAPAFFALELVTLFKDLATEYNDNSYRKIAELIYEHSWLSTADKIQVPDISLEPLQNLTLELLPYQKEFIRLWDRLKSQLNTNGYILAFKPGKGKTLTAIGLAECIKAPKVYVICPNALKENWALEIKKYYKAYQDNEALWHQDVVILGAANAAPAPNAKFVICNNEALGKLAKQVHKVEPEAMIILDESHNFANYNGTRSQELFAIADTIQSKNILCMSATPIKAVPAEIAPVLRLIDPTFTDEAAKMFARCFELNNAAAMVLIERRFGKIIYRPENADVPLPAKHESIIKIPIPNESRYYLSTVHDEIVQVFKDLHDEWLKTNQAQVGEFQNLIYQYSMASRKDTQAYLNWAMSSANSLNSTNSDEFHELTNEEYKHFIENFVRPNPACTPAMFNTIAEKEKKFVTAAKSHMGTAIGGIIHDRRAEMFNLMYDAYAPTAHEQIRNRTKKTIIFSTMVPVVEHIYEELKQFGIPAVKITGVTKNRLEVLTRFKEDPSILVMVATSQTLGTGLTLIEASQMFFFGTPWRSINFEQAADRIWRIGQTEEVDIITAVMDSKKSNLSTRMQDILEWSDRMFNAAVTPTQLTEEFTSVMEAETLLDDTTKKVITLYNEIKDFAYGCDDNGKIVNPQSDEEFDRLYRSLTASTFKRLKGGVCWDYVAYQNEWLNKHGVSSFNYYIDYGSWGTPSHTITVIPTGFGCLYIEASFKMIKGVYRANTLDDVLNFVIDRMKEYDPENVSVENARVVTIPMSQKLTGLNVGEYLTLVIKNGKPVKFKKSPRNSVVPIQTEFSALESFQGYNVHNDGEQYVQIDDVKKLDLIQTFIDCFYTARNRDIPKFKLDNDIRFSEPHKILYGRLGLNSFDSVAKVYLELLEKDIKCDLWLFLCPAYEFFKLTCCYDDAGGKFLIDPNEKPVSGASYGHRAGVFYTERGLNAIGTSLLAQHAHDIEAGTQLFNDGGADCRYYRVSHKMLMQAICNSWTYGEFIVSVVRNSDEFQIVDTAHENERELHRVEVLNHGIILSRF